MKAYTALAHVLQDRNAAVAEVRVVPLGSGLVPPPEGRATGSSKRENGERYDETVGADLALGRAFEALGQGLIRSAMARYNALNPTKEPMTLVPNVEDNELVMAIVERVTAGEHGELHIEAARVNPGKAESPKKAAKPRRLSRKRS